MSIPISRNLLGLGVAASLFLGCQQFTGQDDGKPSDPALRIGEVAEADSAHPPVPPVPTLCDSLRHALAAFDPVADPLGYGEAKHRLYEACMSKEPVAPPPPPPAPPPTLCDSLRHALEAVDPAAEPHRYDEAKRRMSDACFPPGSVTPPPAEYTPASCAAMRAQLSDLDPATEKYVLFRTFINEVCAATP